MTVMSGRRWAVALCAVSSGVLLAWVGGFMLSSGNGRCVDGPEIRECSGAFASSTWHSVGMAAVIVGMIVVFAAVWFAMRIRRHNRLTGP